VIHIVRDPRDVILSLMGRGLSVSKAAERWLTALSSIHNYRNHPNVLEIKYEDLILETGKTLSRVSSHLNLEFNMEFFTTNAYESKNITKADGFDSWRSKPADGFSSKSIGKYKGSNIVFEDILSMTLTKEFAACLKVEQLSLSQLADNYGYKLTGMHSTDKNHLRRSTCKEEQSIISKLVDLVIDKNRYVRRVIY